jgi:hypothetical protein
MGGLPTWARTILLIAALPGIAAIVLYRNRNVRALSQ